jgi:hypothetical protein
VSVGRTSDGYTGNLGGPAYDLAPFWPRTGGRARPPRAGRPTRDRGPARIRTGQPSCAQHQRRRPRTQTSGPLWRGVVIDIVGRPVCSGEVCGRTAVWIALLVG